MGLDNFMDNPLFDNPLFPRDRARMGMLWAEERGFKRLPDENQGLEQWDDGYKEQWIKKLLVTINNQDKDKYSCVAVRLTYRPPRLKDATLDKEGSWTAEAWPEIHGDMEYSHDPVSTPPSVMPSICLSAISKDVMEMIQGLQGTVRKQ
ncbi:MAG: hypothetical protein J6Y62_06855 [Clostridia bacterium]|nr:hypothetical protein [Clostridia bacterium]